MSDLRANITIAHRNVRSVNLEQEFHSESPLEGFIAAEQILDGVRRFEELCREGPSSRAWSVTGPYGAGKSSFAHFLLALGGPFGDPSHDAAMDILDAGETILADRFNEIRDELGVAERGFIQAVATAEREPIANVVLRALERGATSFWAGRSGRRPRVLMDIEQLSRNAGDVRDPREVLQVLDDLIVHTPVLIVIDELGKALEYAAERIRESDLYLLQQLAERFSSSEKMDGSLIALQHLAFEDYAGGLSVARRHEWRKIQGRFEDVPFIGGVGHSARLLGKSISLSGLSRSTIARSRKATRELVKVDPELAQLFSALGEPPAGYPLHPTVVPALIELAGRYGQHDRSLMSFLTSEESGALTRWIEDQADSDEDAPFFRLHDLYDYFVEGTAGLGISGEDATRLREIRNRLAEAVNLSPTDIEVLKTIGILNLVGRGDYRASGEVLTQALIGPVADKSQSGDISASLKGMIAGGLLVFREFADEYRVWQGSDFDISGALGQAREELSQEAVLHGPPVDRLSKAVPANPLVASRHSQEIGTLRYFETRYASNLDDEALVVESAEADGLLIYQLAPEENLSEVPSKTSDGKPIVVLSSSSVQGVTDAAIDAAAALSVLESSKALEHDVVARQEVRHRAAEAQAALRERIDVAFDPTRTGVSCIARGSIVKISKRRDLAELLSVLCDESYPKSTHLSNEMLNRRELTSQGAKARRELIELMCLAEGDPMLGIEGHGPLRSLYDSVLFSTGMHAEKDGVWAIRAPEKKSGVRTAWDRISTFFDSSFGEAIGLDQLFQELNAPPYGVKTGPIPVFLVAALLVRRDDVFVFEEQTFLPKMGPEHFERLVKTPGRFSVKKAEVGGIRAEVFRELQDLVGDQNAGDSPEIRNATTLAVVRPLIGSLQALPDYAKQTKRVSDVAQGVRTALQTTREPDELIFKALPEACGFDESLVRSDEASEATVSFVSTAKVALDELSGAYDLLLESIASSLRSAFRTAGPAEGLREDLRTRSRHLISHVIDRRLRAFLLTASGEELDDQEWLEAIATILAQKPPGSWKDSDIAVFESAAIEVAGPFKRLELLHLQMDETGRDGFTASRVTLTRSDGTESGEVVMVEDSKRAALVKIVEDAVTLANSQLGSNSAQGLLALLAEEVVTDGDAKVIDSASDSFSDEERAS